MQQAVAVVQSSQVIGRGQFLHVVRLNFQLLAQFNQVPRSLFEQQFDLLADKEDGRSQTDTSDSLIKYNRSVPANDNKMQRHHAHRDNAPCQCSPAANQVSGHDDRAEYEIDRFIEMCILADRYCK